MSIVLLGADRPNTVDGTIVGAMTDTAAALRKLRRVIPLGFFVWDIIPPVHVDKNLFNLIGRFSLIGFSLNMLTFRNKPIMTKMMLSIVLTKNTHPGESGQPPDISR